MFAILDLFFRLICLFFFSLQRDRITSFRKSTVKKEKHFIQHPIDSQVAMSEFPAPQPLYDERSLNLSEKEVLDLFEKMMVRSTPNFVVILKCMAENNTGF